MTDKTYTRAEHEAVLERAVADAVAAATADKDARILELENANEVLEGEKAAAVSRAEASEQAFEDHKTKQAEREAAAARSDDRLAQVKAVASDLPESFYTDERRTRWAEMADEQFETLLDDYADAALARLTAEERKELDGLEGEARRSKLVEIQKAKADSAPEAEESTGARQTAAFTGGTTPAGQPAGGTKASAFLGARGLLPS